MCVWGNETVAVPSARRDGPTTRVTEMTLLELDSNEETARRECVEKFEEKAMFIGRHVSGSDDTAAWVDIELTVFF